MKIGRPVFTYTCVLPVVEYYCHVATIVSLTRERATERDGEERERERERESGRERECERKQMNETIMQVSMSGIWAQLTMTACRLACMLLTRIY